MNISQLNMLKVDELFEIARKKLGSKRSNYSIAANKAVQAYVSQTSLDFDEVSELLFPAFMKLHKVPESISNASDLADLADAWSNNNPKASDCYCRILLTNLLKG